MQATRPLRGASRVGSRLKVVEATASANLLPGVSGKDARHARMTGTQQRTLSIDTAREFIGRVLTTWIDRLP